ncbi:MAG: 50S ribosomal protein L15 [Dehalococcoides mccartyi]|uniref:Large ribosomal subunit protein uL15 n=3 Tax=root TaxID=1 RepID=RL15_DEHM1|nr:MULTISPECIES: 50S ribosomal protein L15 [Dehalococcoides]Q3Z962.1 RecName: Full=Large ribosomal subunit protein uL15; AltName: Full=50S ribosomal protein L15 [Dehalococcoides mccartyi 195]AAW40273.1 ribosomal protein L15 [Dehalococcoides mccartyi 195]AII59178.1 50S ribosomal protein L15 [Dehalococcoides mccartyi CG4]KSV18697.1 50S ribosomal protein L15 [Dehalococcoides mccartyi]MBF4482649.1 50S ribosomal protein L15 [Dehalococcoides mccartyi]MBJ7532352.1 50S ribosomal protein L15 [Dehaloco
MRLNELSPAPGSKKDRKRVGRGDAGRGNYSGRGMKGQKARSGGATRPGFEGGQLPIYLRLPRKRGFFNPFRIEYTVVNIEQLNIFEAGTEVTPETMLAAGLIRNFVKPVKILAAGHIDRALEVSAHKFSQAAKAQIEAAGGKVQEIDYAAEIE